MRNLVEQTASQFAQQGMDVKSTFTPDLVRSLMEASREEAETNLRSNLALQALASAEDLKLEDKEIETKLKEVKRELSQEKNIDPQRLRQAVSDDLLRDKLLDWLEENSTVTEKAAESEPASKKPEAKAKAKTSKPKSTKTKPKAEKTE
ncbi:MAG: Trigger factor [Prochlorococcus marinus str. MIT 9215]|nr:MAG: Trigger factor [Prochlorococcus marinus str. MIT 9215]